MGVRPIIYFKIITMVVSALGLLIYTLLLDRKYFFPLLVAEVICAGFLSFYIFYYIGSYSSAESETRLETNYINNGSGQYSLVANVQWKRKPEIFGLDGNKDALILRYDPKLFEITGADKEYEESELGASLIELEDEYKYSEILKTEKEICFDIKDGENATIRTDLKVLKPESKIKIFFLHDYKIPFESPVYWEKQEVIQFK